MKLIENIKDYNNVPDKYLRIKEEPECFVVKYSNKAFFDSAWNTYPELLQARGHCFDKISGGILARPFDKVFNYGQEVLAVVIISQSLR